MFRKVLIANRGEIACRLARTLRRMGIAVATIHSSADADALHVREIGESVLVGGEAARESYLDIEAVIAAALRVGADAVHPGFGFLSENAAFARRCAEAGLVFIGPAPEALELFGDKARAKQLAASLDIPVARGIETPSEDVDALLASLADMPRPFILKAAAGGGGKGMRVVREGVELRPAIEAAIREGRSAFGDGRLIAERYLAAPRHIEVQVLGDGHGDAIHLHDRECSLQRRFQKVVEEAPVTSIDRGLREQLWAHAVAIARRTNYLGLGTVEFAVTRDGAVFLEVNPRLQVEHPVTEAVTGLDLVQLQVETVASGRLPLAQADVPPPRGVAVQARLYAEDASRGFLPATGRVQLFEVPASVRCDAGVQAGSEVTPHYDPMVAKLVAHGATREQALDTLRAALVESMVLGVTTNRQFLVDLLGDETVRRNELSTEFIDGWLAAQPPRPVSARDVAALSALWLAHLRDAQGLGAWGDTALNGWRIARGGAAEPPLTWKATGAQGEWQVGFAAGRVRVAAVQGDRVWAVNIAADHVTVDNERLALRIARDRHTLHARIGSAELSLDFAPLHDAAHGASSASSGAVRAPMMGILVGVHASAGQQVRAGERLATLESMKMEMTIDAPLDGIVAWVGCEPRGKVERHQELFRIEPA